MSKYYLSKRSNGYYYIQYFDENGKHKLKSTGKKTKNEALSFLSNFKESNQAKANTNLKPVIDLFLDYSKANHVKRHTQNYQAKLKRFYDYAGNVQLSKINTAFIQTYINQLMLKSKTLANKDLMHLKAFFNFAINQELIQNSPCNRIKRIVLPEKQPLFLTENDLIKLLEKIKQPDFIDLIIFATNTGMRLSEIINLRWNQIDLQRETVILDNQSNLTKSRKVRAIPLNTSAKRIILKRTTKQHDFVFTLNGNQFKPSYISHEFKKAVRRSGINEDLHFHSLRHSFGSLLVMNDVPIYSVSKLLGHSDVKTTMIYSHLAPENLKKEVELISINLN